MNPRLIAGLVVALGFGAMVAAADEAAIKRDAAQPAVTAQPEPPTRPENCIRDTGSHIKPRPGECLNVPGRSHGRDEIDETGRRNDLGRALQQIDPSVR